MDDPQSSFELPPFLQKSSEQSEKIFIEFCWQKLNIVVSSSGISICQRLGKSQASGTKPRLLLVRLTNRKMKMAIMNAKKGFRGCGVYISEHLTQETSAIFVKARNMVKEKRLNGVWTWKAVLHFRLNESQGSKIIKIAITSDLNQYWSVGSYPYNTRHFYLFIFLITNPCLTCKKRDGLSKSNVLWDL